VSKSEVFKIKDKVNKKENDLKTSKGEKKEQELEKLISLKNDLKEQRKKSLLTEIPDWLTECANKAESVGKPMFKNSHPTKFTNGDIQYGGIYIRTSQVKTSSYLTTESIRNSYYDISQSNGNLITHSLFLMQKLDTETVYEKLEKSDFSWLLEFTDNEKTAQSWGKRLKLWMGEKILKDASGLKQNYFHLSNANYHLIAPLFSSTLCQVIYEKIRVSKFDDNNKKRRDGVYSESILSVYPNIAVMNFGGTQPQNITAGNFDRHGEAYLLSCAPPHWQSSLKPPLNIDSIFHGEFDRRAWKAAKELQTYLKKLQEKDSKKEIREQVKQTVEQLIDTLLTYAAEIQSLENQAGWSESSKLKQAHKLWLDPYRSDDLFQTERKSSEWQLEICRDFGLWLNKKLQHEKMLFAKIESSHWAKLLKRPLQEFEQDLEALK